MKATVKKHTVARGRTKTTIDIRQIIINLNPPKIFIDTIYIILIKSSIVSKGFRIYKIITKKICLRP